jgi:hypothetical protein
MMGSLAYGAPSIIGSRTVVEQWGTAPVTDDIELRLLQIAYRRVFGYQDTLDDDQFADDLAHELKTQLSVTDDLKDLYRLFYQDPAMVAGIKQTVTELANIGIKRTEYDILGALVVASNTDKIVQDNELVAADDFSTSRTKEIPLGKLLPLRKKEKPRTINAFGTRLKNPMDETISRVATPVIQEVRRQIKDTEDNLEQITPNWFGVGSHKKDVPANACYVGHHVDRCGEHYVWVCPDQRDALAKFTMTILGLSTMLQERQIVTIPGGPSPAPASAYLR